MQPTPEQIKAASEVCADLIGEDPLTVDWNNTPVEVVQSLAVLAKEWLVMRDIVANIKGNVDYKSCLPRIYERL
jgi:hypothetical protein